MEGLGERASNLRGSEAHRGTKRVLRYRGTPTVARLRWHGNSATKVFQERFTTQGDGAALFFCPFLSGVDRLKVRETSEKHFLFLFFTRTDKGKN